MLSSDISDKSFNELFSSIFIKNRAINCVKSPEKNKNKVIRETLAKNGLADVSVNHAHLLISDLQHGPFQQFIDGSIKFDFLGKKDFNLIGHTHPLHIKDQISKLMVNQVDLKELIESLTKSSELRLKHIANTFSEISMKAKAVLSDFNKIVTFPNSFCDLVDFDNDSIIYLNEQDTNEQIQTKLESLSDDDSVLFALEIQNERTFNLNQHTIIKNLANWAIDHHFSIWINETYGFGRHKEFIQSFNKDMGINPNFLTCGNDLIGYYFLDRDSEHKFSSNPNLTDKVTKNAFSTINFLSAGKFWGENGRISIIEKSITNKLSQLKSQFTDFDLNYSVSGNMVHLQIFNNDSTKIKQLSIELFHQGILVGLEKSHGKWIRFKLPTSLKNEHFDIIEKVFNNSLNSTTTNKV